MLFDLLFGLEALGLFEHLFTGEIEGLLQRSIGSKAQKDLGGATLIDRLE